MKLWRVTSLFYFFIGGIFFCNSFSVVFGQTKKNSILSQKKLDSISQYYELSKSKFLSDSEKLLNASSFFKASLLYQKDSLIFNALMQKTMLLGRTRQYDSAIIYTHRLYDLAKQNKDTIYIRKALTKLGRYHKDNDQLAEAFNYFNEAFKVSKIINDSINAGRNLLRMANIQAMLGDYSGSKTTGIDGMKYVENTSDYKTLAGLYHSISVANTEQENYRDGLKYNYKALNLEKDALSAKIIGNNNFLVYKNSRAVILAKQKKYKKALSIISELVADSIVKRNKREYARVIDNFGYIKWLENKTNNNSESLLVKARGLRGEEKDVQGLIASHIHLTKYYFEENRTKALEYAKAAYQNALELKSLTSIIEALGYIFQLKKDVTEEAKVFNETYLKLKEINQSNREIYAVTKYENENLTNENLKLEADNAKLAIEKAKEERENIIYLLGTLILILSGGFVFYLLQQKHKRERIRDVFNAETRISKKLHDELANDVYHVMTQIQNERNDQEVLDKLENIYSRTRDFSRENSSFKLGKSYTQELSGMLSSYGSDHTKIIIKDIDDINWGAITPEKKIIIHRIIQELMVNMKKHSNASLVAVTFKKAHKTIEISYADNGVGVAKNEMIYSSGLQNAENRIKTIGGSFIFDSEEGKGFKARIHFPN